MARICVRCKRQLQPQEEYRTEKIITQGLCTLCTKQFIHDVPETIREVLNNISEPVLIIDSRGIVMTANDGGMRLLGKGRSEIEGNLGGDVFCCAFASLPEGCGRTDHCRTCAIRNIVMDTLVRGIGYSNVPAFQNIRTPHGERIMRFHVSTEKVEDQILLRIDNVMERVTV